MRKFADKIFRGVRAWSKNTSQNSVSPDRVLIMRTSTPG